MHSDGAALITTATQKLNMSTHTARGLVLIGGVCVGELFQTAVIWEEEAAVASFLHRKISSLEVFIHEQRRALPF